MKKNVWDFNFRTTNFKESWEKQLNLPNLERKWSKSQTFSLELISFRIDAKILLRSFTSVKVFEICPIKFEWGFDLSNNWIYVDLRLNWFY